MILIFVPTSWRGAGAAERPEAAERAERAGARRARRAGPRGC